MKLMTYWLIGCLTIGPTTGWYTAQFPNCEASRTSDVLMLIAIWPAAWSSAFVAVAMGHKSKECTPSSTRDQRP